eukprot:TRINITY_DN76924_c0_g1_i1.p1 TRINITY_DN76924_c0_g1~~TRINITY_DN76924_c0_g1_i1.p1  ORF type:complete len:266 (+),score=40.16 TRINITY_DN76924_c0_g1_i1:61-858(+)
MALKHRCHRQSEFARRGKSIRPGVLLCVAIALSCLTHCGPGCNIEAWITIGRRAVSIGLALGQVAVNQPLVAHAQVPPILEASLRRYAKPLQLAADELVLEVRPSILAGNWSTLDTLFKGESDFTKANADILQPVKYIVDGSEDFLPGAENAVDKLKLALQDMSSQTRARSTDGALKAWDAAAAALNSAIVAANAILSEQPATRDSPKMPLLVLATAEAGKYSRTTLQYYIDRCRRAAPSAVFVGDSVADLCVPIAEQQLQANSR